MAATLVIPPTIQTALPFVDPKTVKLKINLTCNRASTGSVKSYSLRYDVTSADVLGEATVDGHQTPEISYYPGLAGDYLLFATDYTSKKVSRVVALELPSSGTHEITIDIRQDPLFLDQPGEGTLSGSFPEGLTTVDGVPAKATVRVLARRPGMEGDGVQVAEVESAQDGTWLVTGLAMGEIYDVIARKPGYNDIIIAGVTPGLE